MGNTTLFKKYRGGAEVKAEKPSFVAGGIFILCLLSSPTTKMANAGNLELPPRGGRTTRNEIHTYTIITSPTLQQHKTVLPTSHPQFNNIRLYYLQALPRVTPFTFYPSHRGNAGRLLPYLNKMRFWLLPCCCVVE